eukprot:TRINITY_DN1350_c0_g3_i2.p2 TRINITY_DN1350_c0_g3~~TRINITY_DN1350_c0_g3_i2.p2  ORF type:complete len:194 (+),score=32.66 TRINITY_DN1350_c0_g3_i2:3-584(+)
MSHTSPHGLCCRTNLPKHAHSAHQWHLLQSLHPDNSCSLHPDVTLLQDHDTAVAVFMATTSCEDPTLSRTLLEASDWKVEQAVELFFSLGPVSSAPKPARPAAPPAARPATRAPFLDEDDVRAPIPSRQQVLLGSPFAPRPAPRVSHEIADVFSGVVTPGGQNLADKFKAPTDIITEVPLVFLSLTSLFGCSS